jgi:hypothetical protein
MGMWLAGPDAVHARDTSGLTGCDFGHFLDALRHKRTRKNEGYVIKKASGGETALIYKRALAPLRVIVEVLIPAVGAYDRQKVRLECGHKSWASGSAIYRARCQHCRSHI